jgi:hypothetical protein
MTSSALLSAVNDFLDAVYAPETRLSTLLIDEGFTQEHVAMLRQHLNQLLDAFVTSVAARLTEYDDGERRYRVLARRYGLDGAPRATLADLAQDLDVSRERVRQIEESSLRRCRFAKNRRRWQEQLARAAVALLAEDGVHVPVQATHDETTLDTPEDVTLERLSPVVQAIEQAIGAKVTNHLIANVLRGSPGPVTRAMTGYYRLESASGTFADIELRALTELVGKARPSRVMSAESPREIPVEVAGSTIGTAASVKIDPEHTLSAADLAHVEEMVMAIEESVGRRLSRGMLTHILAGSHGPRVESLVKQHHLFQYRALESWGFKVVKAAANVIRSEPDESDIAESHNVADDHAG